MFSGELVGTGYQKGITWKNMYVSTYIYIYKYIYINTASCT